MVSDKLRIRIVVLFLLFFLCSSAYSQDNYPVIGEMEDILFGMSSPNLKISDRISTVEKNIFGKTYPNDSLDTRTERLKANVIGVTDNSESENPEAFNVPVSMNQKAFDDGYENAQAVEVNNEQFQEFIYQFINDERSFKGLLPLTRDDIAVNVAFEQAKEILTKGFLSYSDLKNQYPDERYTLAGGTGADIEVVKGFEKNPNEKKIKLTELLAKQLIKAIEANPDDAQILYSPYINHCGFGFAVSGDKTGDKKRFVSVVEFLTKDGEFEPIKPAASLNEKLKIIGKINSPYKFKAISVAYFDSSRLDFNDDNPGNFGNENLKPYFPPQDYIAYSNTAKSNFMKVIKGIGVIGAIGAAPFTGGASAILAPALISSIQNGPPREIPLKGGIKVNSKGDFSGEIELNYGGKGGLYYISVLAERPGINFPVVISRRTVRVNGFLPVTKNLIRKYGYKSRTI